MAGISSKALAFGQPDNKMKFTGQLLDDDLGWNTYQMKFRTHDPQIGRFLQIDPLAAKYVHNSTFAYAENDIMRAVDVEGLEKFIITGDPNESGASVVTYDPTPIKDLAGRFQVLDSRTGSTTTDAFPEMAMQANLGVSFVNSEGDLYIQPDASAAQIQAGCHCGDWTIKNFENPIAGDQNPRGGVGAQKQFALQFGASPATPMKEETRDITDKVISAPINQNVSGTFEKSTGTVTHNFSIPGSSTNPTMSISTNDGGTYHNNFNIISGGKTLATIANSGSGNVTVPANSTLKVQITGVPKLGADIYSVDVNITTTKSVQVTTFDRSKL